MKGVTGTGVHVSSNPSADLEDSRDDKRYTEKKNKSERARRKKDDTARLRGLVDLALQHDPRIKRIKQEEKEAREAKKRTKGNSGVSTPSQAAQEEAKWKEEQEAKEEAEKVSPIRIGLRLVVLTMTADGES